MIVKLLLSYDGTAYCGWQVQSNGTSIQQVLETALYEVTGKNIRITGSGRTDAGVHAEGQVAHFEIEEENIPAEKFYRALNVHLPPDIRVLKSERANDNFNARKSAKRKTYGYYIYFCDTELPLKERFYYKLDKKPDICVMKECAQIFIGEHDFKCFCASGSAVNCTVRTIYDIEITQKDNEICFFVTGNGFLYNMVRTLVGTLLEAGYKKIDKQKILELLKTGDRNLCGKTMPAKALRLIKVEY